MNKKEKEDNGRLPKQKDQSETKTRFPAYPLYPANEDIYSKDQKMDNIDPEDISKMKEPNDNNSITNEKDLNEDESGGDLDIPGSESDEMEQNAGSEDEENNYYSLGGDNHNELEEDKGE